MSAKKLFGRYVRRGVLCAECFERFIEMLISI